jgi:hypothetical protein
VEQSRSPATRFHDDLSAPPETPQPVARLQRLGVNFAVAQRLARSTAMARSKSAELLGANDQSLSLTGADAKTSVKLDGRFGPTQGGHQLWCNDDGGADSARPDS